MYHTWQNRQGTQSFDNVIKTRSDGESYFSMIHSNKALTTEADNYEELIAALIDNYARLSEQEQRDARVAYARDRVKRIHIALLISSSGESLTDAEAEVLTATGPIVLKEYGMSVWSSELPLALISMDYSPYTEVKAPLFARDILAPNEDTVAIWIRPETTESFLESLCLMEDIQIYHHN